MKGFNLLSRSVCVALFISCTNKEEVLNLPPTSNIQLLDAVNKFSLDASLSVDPENQPLTYAWSTSSDKIEIKNPTLSNAYFQIPNGSTSFKADITLKVSDGQHSTTSTQSLDIPPLTDIRAFGLGTNLIKEVSNNVEFEWYLDQQNTGTYNLVNCGPTSVTMAIKWINPNFTKTPEDARNTYRAEGGWWYTSDITNYLDKYEVPNDIINLTNIDLLKEELDNGNIIILCLDMYYIDMQSDQTYRFNKFYETFATGWGHFIVVKGYKEVNDKTFFEVYDPYSLGKTYSDYSMKGKNRYYKAAN